MALLLCAVLSVETLALSVSLRSHKMVPLGRDAVLLVFGRDEDRYRDTQLLRLLESGVDAEGNPTATVRYGFFSPLASPWSGPCPTCPAPHRSWTDVTPPALGGPLAGPTGRAATGACALPGRLPDRTAASTSAPEGSLQYAVYVTGGYGYIPEPASGAQSAGKGALGDTWRLDLLLPPVVAAADSRKRPPPGQQGPSPTRAPAAVLRATSQSPNRAGRIDSTFPGKKAGPDGEGWVSKRARVQEPSAAVPAPPVRVAAAAEPDGALEAMIQAQRRRLDGQDSALNALEAEARQLRVEAATEREKCRLAELAVQRAEAERDKVRLTGVAKSRRACWQPRRRPCPLDSSR